VPSPDARRLPLAQHAALPAAFMLATVWIPAALAIGLAHDWHPTWTTAAVALEAAAIAVTIDLGLRARRLGHGAH